jgi:hypothetical protein
MPITDSKPRFQSLSDFFAYPEELTTVKEFALFSPFPETQIRWWFYNAGENGFEDVLVRPNQRRLYIHSGRFKRWLEDRTAAVRKERELDLVG